MKSQPRGPADSIQSEWPMNTASTNCEGPWRGGGIIVRSCLRFPPSRRPSTLDGCVRTLDHENVSSLCATTISATADSRVRQGNELAHRGQFSLNDNRRMYTRVQLLDIHTTDRFLVGFFCEQKGRKSCRVNFFISTRGLYLIEFALLVCLAGIMLDLIDLIKAYCEWNTEILS